MTPHPASLLLLAALAPSASAQTPLVATQEAKLVASDAAGLEYFGQAVSIEGDTAVVGATRDNVSSNAGAAYVFVRSGSSWTEQAKLTASDGAADDRFGISVAISGDTVVVGAYGDDDAGTLSGSAYVFVRNGTTWSEQAKLTASDADMRDYFGYSVSVSGDTALVGAYGVYSDASGGSSGAAYVFVRNGTSWSEEAKLLQTDPVPFGGDWFGSSVSLEGDTALIGAPQVFAGGFNEGGAAYVFTRTGTTWSEQQRLAANTPAFTEQFGRGVSLSLDRALVGDGDDEAYVFLRTGSSWNLEARLTVNDTTFDPRFGFSVALSGDLAVVGAHQDDSGGPDSGSAYVFRRDGVTWNEEVKLTACDPADFDFFGESVAISGGTTVVGSRFDDDAGPASGSAYVFVLDESPTVDPGTPFCFGTGCPCGNDDPSGTHGCATSTGAGATLVWCGSPSVSDDELTLIIRDVPSPDANGLVFMGPGTVAPFVPTSADGFACTGGGLRFPGILDDNLPPDQLVQTHVVSTAAAAGVGISAGETWYFQGWFRDNNGSPCGGASNLSSGHTVTFTL